MSTKQYDNWLHELRSLMNNNMSHRRGGQLQSDEVESASDEVKVQLRKEMAKKLMDSRMRQATYGYLTMI